MVGVWVWVCVVVVLAVGVDVSEELFATGDGDLVCFREVTEGDADDVILEEFSPVLLRSGDFILVSSPAMPLDLLFLIYLHFGKACLC